MYSSSEGTSSASDHVAANATPVDGRAWIERAQELADWAFRCLVNRQVAYGGHHVRRAVYERNPGYPRGSRHPDALREIKPAAIERTTVHQLLFPSRLVSHFKACAFFHLSGCVIGLHASSPSETCRWVAVDIDAHDGQGAIPANNLRFATHVRRKAHKAGLDVRLLDTSGGRGGYHVWVALAEPVPMPEARRLVLWLVDEWASFGLVRRPDLFPGNSKNGPKGFSNWLRLPGRHPKRPEWSRVWAPRRKQWLEGHEAIDSLVRLVGKPADVPAITNGWVEPEKRGHHAVRRPPRKTVTDGADHERNARLARAALEYLGAEYYDERETWIRVGMTLVELGEEGLDLWDAWSQQSDKYQEPDLLRNWSSFRDGVGNDGMLTLGSLFQMALDEGWPGPAAIEERLAWGNRVRDRRRGITRITFSPDRADNGGEQR